MTTIKTLFISTAFFIVSFAYGFTGEDTKDTESSSSSGSVKEVKKSKDMNFFFDEDFMIKLTTEVSKKSKFIQKSEFDLILEQMNGKNLTGSPVDKEVIDFIKRRVGEDNQKPFLLKVGPQIIFEENIDLFR